MEHLSFLERHGVISESERLELWDLICVCRTSDNNDVEGEIST